MTDFNIITKEPINKGRSEGKKHKVTMPGGKNFYFITTMEIGCLLTKVYKGMVGIHFPHGFIDYMFAD